MEKITKPTVIEIPSLKALAENYIKWGEEFEQKLKNGGKSSNFSWKGGVYKEIRDQLCSITKNHCSFCDDYPIGTQSKETIEHYFPKEKYPLLSYDWENLFYCCDKCQSEANKTLFQETLKPSDASYHFTKYFYFDLASGEIKVLENLETESPIEFVRASAFLVRYGICSNPKRNEARKRMYKIIMQVLLSDDMQRDDFEYRYVYDFCMERLGIK
jgi:uncharacterized protein (TIGR02646 family)